MKQKKVRLPDPPADVAVHPRAGVVAIAGCPDRVWYSFGLTLQPVQFESVRFDIGHATDVRADETPEQALIRVAEYIHDAAAQQAASIRGQNLAEVPGSAGDRAGRRTTKGNKTKAKRRK